MDIAKLEQANKLQDQIKECEYILSNCIDYFVGKEWVKILGHYINHSVPKELNNQILELVKQHLEKCKKELKEL